MGAWQASIWAGSTSLKPALPPKKIDRKLFESYIICIHALYRAAFFGCLRPGDIDLGHTASSIYMHESRQSQRTYVHCFSIMHDHASDHAHAG